MSFCFPKCVQRTKVKTAPTLHTERLILRSFCLEDAPDVKQLAWNPNVASTTTAIEYPYIDGMAQEWIKICGKAYCKDFGPNFAVTLRSDGTLIGTVELLIRRHLPHNDAELGYWIGEPYWNCGYCTEAAKVVMRYGFRECNLDQIFAYHFKRNPASGRVLQKIGMQYWDHFPNDVKHWGKWEDQIGYTLSKKEYEAL